MGVDFFNLLHRDMMVHHRSRERCTKSIYNKYSRAIFVDCSLYTLNVVLNDQSKFPIIRSTNDIIGNVIRFYKGSLKRRASLEIGGPRSSSESESSNVS